MIITTPHTQLRCWEEADRDAFASMHADPEVMQDYGGSISRSESDTKFDRYIAAYRHHGFCRWAIESREALFSVTLAFRVTSRTAAFYLEQPPADQ
jgi:RimJ/RimL family protein N-acetyltransferase